MEPEPFGMEFDPQLNKTVITEYFTREQYGAYSNEGFIFQFLVVLFSLLFALLLRIQKIFENSLKKRVFMLMVLSAIFFVYEFVLIKIIKIKMPWFDPKLTPPDFMF